MTNGRFHKMHGLGNDFVIIDCRDTPLEMTAAKACAIAVTAPALKLTAFAFRGTKVYGTI